MRENLVAMSVGLVLCPLALLHVYISCLTAPEGLLRDAHTMPLCCLVQLAEWVVEQP